MTRVIRAQHGDLGPLSAVIAGAFFGLPPSPWLVSDEAERRRIFPGYFRLCLEHALAEGEICTTPDRSAAALWIPAGPEPTGPPPGYAGRLLAATRPWTRRFAQFDALLDQARPQGVPHHHLAILAVRPDLQGQGIGSALLSAHHRALDQAGLAACLEASSDRSRLLYLRHGYTDSGPPIQLPGGPAMHPMIRTPQPKPASTAPMTRTVAAR